LSDFNEPYRVLKNTEISNFMKIRPDGTELFHVDGRTDRHDEDNSRFSQFYERRLKITNSNHHIPSREVKHFSASQEIPRIL